jgi:predicted nuclease with TOPRIM domain
MPSGEERLEAVEAHVHDHTHALLEVRAAFGRLEHRFDPLEGRFDRLEGRFDVLEGRFDILERRFDRLEGRFDRLFMWSVSIQITVLVAVVSAFAAMLGILLTRT